MSMYAAMIDRFDQGLGRVLAELEQEGQLDNTLIMFSENWKITADGREPWRLFDLTRDRFERRDLAAEHPDVVRQLAAEWQIWADRVGALRHGQP
jgi:arylsulfatase A-like enzyme